MEVINLDNFYLAARRHAKDPHNLGILDNFNGHAKVTGPCGDTMEFWLQVEGERIKKISFITDGCDPSLASGSITTCLAEGKSITEAAAITQQDVLKALEGLPEDHQHCALLAANTLAAACDDYLIKQK
ncbi:MAG: iron-sulfur cluster assembly scaffold protein [Deltaproteobacteria bacterium HGW-Deltaproteobacteria-12]|jgi:nitrogen fixation NifU-like protein|nr:MAG: iron-sulfur cluster assembly scaffold protein [Deltaproteobacteria bacterium HGW-Deltaproteobacteria-12]